MIARISLRGLRRLVPKAYLVMLLGLLAVVACHPGQIENLQETDVVLTRFESGARFDTMATYYMPDEVFEIKENEDDPDEWDGQYDDQILSDIRRNIEALGYERIYTEAAIEDSADVVLIVKGITAENWLLYTWYPWYPGYPCCGYYPWYPPYTQAIPFKTGTIQVDLIDVAQTVARADTAVVSWLAALNGAAEGSSSEASRRITNGINQMFQQSPYLKSER